MRFECGAIDLMEIFVRVLSLRQQAMRSSNVGYPQEGRIGPDNADCTGHPETQLGPEIPVAMPTSGY